MGQGVQNMRNAVIVDAVRTAIGKNQGALADWHPVDLGAEVLNALVRRNHLDPIEVEDVILGCTMQVGEQALNAGRNLVLAAGWPESVPGTTVDRQCGSSQQAIHFAAQAVMSGAHDVVIAAGLEHMTRLPIGSSTVDGPGRPYGPRIDVRYAPMGLVHQGVSAEMIAERWDISREELDRFALESHRRAAAATDSGRFMDEIIPIDGTSEGRHLEFKVDEGIRRDTSLAKLAALPTIFKENGRVTAGSSSQISDGAAAVLITSEEAAARLNLRPRARFVAFALAGADPVMMLTAPIPATRKVLAKAGMKLDDMDLVEISEAFASVVLAWSREHHPDLERVNVNGGAIALGHPTGASGSRLMTTLVHELQRRKARFGLQTMCEGGGLANATIIERYD
jgi:acetyl-CoA acetyltransferase family protein